MVQVSPPSHGAYTGLIWLGFFLRLGDPNAVQDFNMLWISEFKKTNAYEVWERVTDPMLFDIVEPR